MKWIEAKVIFDLDDELLTADLISNIFYDLGLPGVVIEEPDVEPLENWKDGPASMPEHYAVAGYFPKNKH
jgi:ribosomal protein L11 methyltransferase